MNSILKVKELSKTYYTLKKEVKAVDNFSFELLEGEFIALVGPSGCGKSTILSILSGLESLDSGTIITNKNCKFNYIEHAACNKFKISSVFVLSIL